MEKKLILYGHNGSANHGCEAIVTSSCDLFEEHAIVYSSNSLQDEKFIINKNIEIIQLKRLKKYSFNWLKSHFLIKAFNNYSSFTNTLYSQLFLTKNSTCLSVGGDVYCYADGMDEILDIINEKLKRNNNKLILWGCSVEPNLLKEKRLCEKLNKYDLIVARESISYQALFQSLNTKVILAPDPAFSLITDNIDLNINKDRKYIGLNVSPFIIKNFDNNDNGFRCVIKFIDYIINDTDYDILLIPHVTWDISNDLKILNYIKNRYANNRVLLIDEMGCTKIKRYISACDFFIGARTHATIAAYSSYVPTLVLGYSVKSLGIATDLFDDDKHYVIKKEQLEDDNIIINEFKWIMDNKEQIISKLNIKIPKYKEDLLKVKNNIKKGIF